MIFAKNLLYKINVSGSMSTERILWIDNSNKECITIDINKDNEKAKPQLVQLDQLQHLFQDGCLEVIKADPYKRFYSEEDLSEASVKIRDERWNLIKDLVKREPDIYVEPTHRIIKEVFMDEKVPVSSIYRFLRIFWQRGMVKNALLPDYHSCGGKGKRKKLGEKKTGRPREGTERKGINVTNEVDYYFKQGLKKCKESKVTKIKDIYKFIIGEYFIDGYRYENGEKIVFLKENIPTREQFLYWYRNHSGKSKAQKNIDKIGERQHNLNTRPVLGKSDTYINGPGLEFQIDSTTSDIYIVSEIDPNLIIGKPTTYFVRDVFSRMVTGMYVGLKETSWAAAKLALVNTITDKVKFCEGYGISITEEEWPTHFFPESLLADNGPEFNNYKIEILNDVFGIRIKNSPAYRADFKGVIEQLFNMINSKLKPHLPGTITKDTGKRGEEDPRLKARMTLRQYTHTMIRTVLFYNNSHWLEKYNPDREMLEHNVELVPLKMWNWGIKRKAGVLKYFTEDYVKVNLLARFENVKVEKYGIHVKESLYYECQRAYDENWFADAAITGSWSVNVAYDPAITNQVYLINKDGTYEVCTLLEKSQQYSDISFAEYDELIRRKKIKQREHQHNELETEINLDNRIKEIANEAATHYENNRKEQTKSSKLKGIRENRKKERRQNDIQEAITLSVQENKADVTLGSKEEIYTENSWSEGEDEDFAFLQNFQKEILGNE